MRIAFVQNLAVEYMGVMYLSAALKENSHKTEIFIDNGNRKMFREIKDYNPHLIAFSCTTGLHEWCLNVARELKKIVPAKVILGGSHPTFFPEVIESEFVDIICRGEGDGAILDLANKMEGKSDYTKTPNLWVSVSGKIIKNDVRPLIKNLDLLPFPDRQLYEGKYPYLKTSQKGIFTGRGCPFSCSYCFNDTLRNIYRGKGQYVRKRSVDNVIEEIELLRKEGKVETVYFEDDVFLIGREWFEEFAVKYRHKVNIPYICLLRVESINEQIVKMLKESNCRNVFFGVETGSEEIRFRLLKRRMTDRQIVAAAALLKKYNIGFRTYNILGLPEETIEDAFKTVHLNTSIGTDYPWCSLLYPYPGTEINTYALKRNLISDKADDRSHISFFKSSVIKLDNKNELENLQKLFFYAVKFPRLEGIIRKLIKIKPNFIFSILFLLSYGWCSWKSENHKISEIIVRGIKNIFKLYFKSS
ncbi:MAG: radical SAM protein [Candidatus Omnitrophica bacterium]|nr:radical SAM protein [Candidatus Omnitrophota bacterium]